MSPTTITFAALYLWLGGVIFVLVTIFAPEKFTPAKMLFLAALIGLFWPFFLLGIAWEYICKNIAEPKP